MLRPSVLAALAASSAAVHTVRDAQPPVRRAQAPAAAGGGGFGLSALLGGALPDFMQPFGCSGASAVWVEETGTCAGCADANCTLPGCQCAADPGVACGDHGAFSHEYQLCVCDEGYESAADAVQRHTYCDVRQRPVEVVVEDASHDDDTRFGFSFDVAAKLFELNPGRFFMLLGLLVLWVGTAVLLCGREARSRVVLVLLNAQRELGLLNSESYYHLAEEYGVAELVDGSWAAVRSSRAASMRMAHTASWRRRSSAVWLTGPKQASVPPLFPGAALRTEEARGDSTAPPPDADGTSEPDSEARAAVARFHAQAQASLRDVPLAYTDSGHEEPRPENDPSPFTAGMANRCRPAAPALGIGNSSAPDPEARMEMWFVGSGRPDEELHTAQLHGLASETLLAGSGGGEERRTNSDDVYPPPPLAGCVDDDDNEVGNMTQATTVTPSQDGSAARTPAQGVHNPFSTTDYPFAHFSAGPSVVGSGGRAGVSPTISEPSSAHPPSVANPHSTDPFMPPSAAGDPWIKDTVQRRTASRTGATTLGFL